MLPPDVLSDMDDRYARAEDAFLAERTDYLSRFKELQADGQWEAAEHMAEEYIEQKKAACRNR